MKHLTSILLSLLTLAALAQGCGRQEASEATSQTEEWQQRDEQRGVNMDAYCKRKFGQTFSARLNDVVAGNWSCVASQNDTRPINVKEACTWQQNTDRVGTRRDNGNLVWFCLVSVPVWVPVRVGVNLEAYCVRNVGADFHATLFGTTVGDWACARNTNDRRPVNVKVACQQQHNTTTVGYRNVNDPHSWYCEK